jgi:hypothetical protein
MTIDKKALLLAQCLSMALLLTERLGESNPWASVDFAAADEAELALSKRLMHELLYSPPPRQ